MTDMARFNIFSLGFLFLSLAAAQGVVVDLDYAQYRGQTLSSSLVQWLGIRYAAPPTGPLRFSAPQDPSVVVGVQDAFEVPILIQVCLCTKADFSPSARSGVYSYWRVSDSHGHI
jgi:cholinesterase